MTTLFFLFALHAATANENAFARLRAQYATDSARGHLFDQIHESLNDGDPGVTTVVLNAEDFKPIWRRLSLARPGVELIGSEYRAPRLETEVLVVDAPADGDAKTAGRWVEDLEFSVRTTRPEIKIFFNVTRPVSLSDEAITFWPILDARDPAFAYVKNLSVFYAAVTWGGIRNSFSTFGMRHAVNVLREFMTEGDESVLIINHHAPEAIRALIDRFEQRVTEDDRQPYVHYAHLVWTPGHLDDPRFLDLTLKAFDEAVRPGQRVKFLITSEYPVVTSSEFRARARELLVNVGCDRLILAPSPDSLLKK